MLLFSYHSRLRMISDVLQLRVVSGQVSHGWCMCVVSHGYGWFGGAGIEMVDSMYAGQSQGGWSHVGTCQSTSRVRREDTDDTRSHHRPGAQLWVGSSRNRLVFLERP